VASTRHVACSILAPEFVSWNVASKWGWKHASCELWHRGTNDTYRIEGRGRRAYLKIYRHGVRSGAEIRGETALLEFLEHHGIAVAHPIKTRAGGFLERVNAAEGRRHAVLFSEAKGVVPVFNRENSRKYGRMAGTVHSATNSLPGAVRRPRLGIDQLARDPLKRIHSFLAGRPRDLAYLTRISRELADAVTSLLPMSSPQFGMCHGDLTFGNVRCDSRGRLTMFDFDCSGYGWRAYDVAVFLQSRGFEFNRRANADRMRQWNGFMEGYHAVRRLSSRELQAVNLFVPLRQIWQLGVHSNQLAHIGSQSMHEARFDSHLEFIRNWIKFYKLL